MKSNVPLQTYVPGNIAAWVEAQARKAAVSRSQWVGTVLADLYEGRVRDEALRRGQAQLQRQMVFVISALDALLACSPDPALWESVHAAFQRKVDDADAEAGQ